MCNGKCDCKKSEAGKLRPGHYWAWVKGYSDDLWHRRIVVEGDKYVHGPDMCSYFDNEKYYVHNPAKISLTDPYKPREMTVDEKREFIAANPGIMVRAYNNDWFRKIVSLNNNGLTKLGGTSGYINFSDITEYTLDLGKTIHKFEVNND